MPPIRSVSIGTSQLDITGLAGAKTLVYSGVIQISPAVAEAAVNTWLAANIPGCQVVCHVFSVSPLRFTVLTANNGFSIPANWWNV